MNWVVSISLARFTVNDAISVRKRHGVHEHDIICLLFTQCTSSCSFFFKVIKISGHEVRALRLSFVGELGWELHIPNDCALHVYKAVMEAGKQHGIINSGYRAIDSLSIEKGKQD